MGVLETSLQNCIFVIKCIRLNAYRGDKSQNQNELRIAGQNLRYVIAIPRKCNRDDYFTMISQQRSLTTSRNAHIGQCQSQGSVSCTHYRSVITRGLKTNKKIIYFHNVQTLGPVAIAGTTQRTKYQGCHVAFQITPTFLGSIVRYLIQNQRLSKGLDFRAQNIKGSTRIVKRIYPLLL